jgi:hypothetical protein
MESDVLVEIVNSSNHNGSYNAIQLLIDERPVLLLGHSDDLHCEILRSYLQQQGLEFYTIQAPGSRVPAQVPALVGPRYLVVGMGKAELETSKKRYTGMHSSNADYRIGINIKHRDLTRRTLESLGWDCFWRDEGHRLTRNYLKIEKTRIE